MLTPLFSLLISPCKHPHGLLYFCLYSFILFREGFFFHVVIQKRRIKEVLMVLEFHHFNLHFGKTTHWYVYMMSTTEGFLLSGIIVCSTLLDTMEYHPGDYRHAKEKYRLPLSVLVDPGWLSTVSCLMMSGRAFPVSIDRYDRFATSVEMLASPLRWQKQTVFRHVKVEAGI